MADFYSDFIILDSHVWIQQSIGTPHLQSDRTHFGTLSQYVGKISIGRRHDAGLFSHHCIDPDGAGKTVVDGSGASVLMGRGDGCE